MLTPNDRADIAERFGADDGQIARDHLISHLLVGLAETVGDSVVFFGGTALSRTHLPAGRLSEDIDLYTTGDRRDVAQALDQRWPRTVRREFPRLGWRSRLTEVRDVEPGLLTSEEGATVRVQLLQAETTYRGWPTERRTIEARYADVSTVELTVPTRTAFVAMKASAWRDRHTARDLFDLAALAACGYVDREAVSLLRAVTGVPLAGAELERVPAEVHWNNDLANQCRLEIDADTALGRVRAAWAQAAGW